MQPDRVASVRLVAELCSAAVFPRSTRRSDPRNQLLVGSLSKAVYAVKAVLYGACGPPHLRQPASSADFSLAAVIMADTPRLPLIAPPRPVFPAQFDSSESSTGPGVSQASWPDDEPQGGGAAASDGAGGEAEGTTWTIKTEREQHLDRLGETVQ